MQKLKAVAERLTGREIIDLRAAANWKNAEQSIMETSSGRPASARNAGNILEDIPKRLELGEGQARCWRYPLRYP